LNVVIVWDNLHKRTIGEQFIRYVNSISDNIAEGFGRYGKKDKIRFYRINSGYLTESLDWNQKAITRKLINEEQYNYIFGELQKLPKAINSLIS
jgi:four helix bundle protein